MRMLAMEEKRRVGRPANPLSRRMHVWVDSTVKRRIVRCAVQNGLPLHELVDTALRQYLVRRRVR
jgi:predicted HicB family RNase H-like nuclease